MTADTTSQFDNLLSSTHIGALTLRNRIVMPAMDQNLCTEDGLLTEANIAHYEQRAVGGAALLIVETSAVAYPHGAASRHQPSLATDDCVPGLAALAARVHEPGARVIVQMCHHGKTSLVDTVEDRPLVVPSVPVPPMNMTGYITDLTTDELMRLGARMQGKTGTHRQATTDDLAAIVEAFAAAARRVERAGCDGVEIHAAHGYLLSGFLSPHWNQRDDEYGGSITGRTRLLREVIESVRASTSDDFCIVVRIDANEFGTSGGITPELAAKHATVAVEAGADAIHVSATGAPDSGVAFTDGPLPWKSMQYRDITKAVKAAVAVPIIAVGRIGPGGGDELIGAGEADLIAMGRQLLADPELPNTLTAGKPELVRPCINCMVCVAQNFWDETPRCAVNAQLGRDPAPLTQADKSRRIAVIGAGPAGLEAARVAAVRGHNVTLIDQAQHLGGTARFSALTTPVNGDFVAYLAASVRAAGVAIELGKPATPDRLRRLDPDVVIVATGARRNRPPIAGAQLNHVLSGDDLRALLTGDDPAPARRLGLAARLVIRVAAGIGVTSKLDRIRQLSHRWMPIGRHVSVIGGGLVGAELAEFLAERGRKVTVLESGSELAVEMAHPRRWRALHEARSRGVTFVTGAEVAEITKDTVTYLHEGDDHTITADSVIIADGVQPDGSLAGILESEGFDVHTIGDANTVGYIEGAVRSAYDLAVDL